MVNNVNPTASKLLEQIKRLSTHTTNPEGKPLNFKNDVMSNRTRDINSRKGAELLNHIEKIQKKNGVSIQALDNTKKEILGKNVQTTELPKTGSAPNNLRREPVGSFLDVYL
jgi:hypothetical protein